MQTKSTPVVLLIGMFAALFGAGAQQPAFPQDTSGPSRATGQSTESSPFAGKALIYVYRVGRVLGAAGYSKIFVNDDFLADLHNDNYAQQEVPQGTVVFATLPRLKRAFDITDMMALRKKAKERLRTEVEAGKTYYVKWSIGDKMKLVDAATGAKEMSGLHPVKD